jgi:hypothetical protein
MIKPKVPLNITENKEIIKVMENKISLVSGSENQFIPCKANKLCSTAT